MVNMLLKTLFETFFDIIFNVGLYHYLVLSAFLFCIGLYGALVKRHALAVLLCIELMLNSVNINLVAFSRFSLLADGVGQIFAIFIIVVAAAEIAIGLAICVALYRGQQTIELEKFNLLKW